MFLPGSRIKQAPRWRRSFMRSFYADASALHVWLLATCARQAKNAKWERQSKRKTKEWPNDWRLARGSVFYSAVDSYTCVGMESIPIRSIVVFASGQIQYSGCLIQTCILPVCFEHLELIWTYSVWWPIRDQKCRSYEDYCHDELWLAHHQY